MDAADLKIFEGSLRQAITREGENATDEALAEVDWRAALAEDPTGATRAVFALLGELNLTSSAIDDVLARALGLDTPDPRAVVLPPLGGHAPPATYDRAELAIAGVATLRARSAERAVVVIGERDVAYVTTVDLSTLDVQGIGGIDPSGGWNAVHGHVKISQLTATDWTRALVAGRLALAQQLTSNARAMLNLAREHALSRSQFDRPIGSFQAVRHKLAESLVAVEGAQAALDAGWDDPGAFTATMAKIIAGTAAKTTARHAQQLLAGMGFTSEHPFHRYLKRSLFLDQLLGSSATLRRGLGKDAIEARAVPPLLPL